MRGAVLCAGLGTRLRPLTHTWPKPALPFLGHPLARYALATLQRAGITEVGFNTHHLPEVMAAAFGGACRALGLPEPRRSHEEVIQGTGGGLRGLADFLGSGVSVVLNGDVLFGVELGPLVEAHRQSGALATMVLLPMPEGEKFNPVELNALGQVRRIAGVGPGGERLTPWHFSGAHLLSPEVFEFMRPGAVEDINRDVYPRAIAAGRVVRGQVVHSREVYWSDLGTPARYLQTHADALAGKVAMAPFGGSSPFTGLSRSGFSWVHPEARLGDARVSGPAWFGAGAELGEGARIGALVSVGPGARVGRGAMLNRVAVLDGAEAPADTLLEDAIVGPGGVVVKREGT